MENHFADGSNSLDLDSHLQDGLLAGLEVEVVAGYDADWGVWN
jgi:hypothetical protein